MPAISHLLCSAQARANSTCYGSSVISYDPNTDTVTATATTDPDYYAEDYYESRVVATLTDNADSKSAYGAQTDTWDAGYASVTLQITGTTPGAVYTLRSLHGFIMDVADPSYGCECYFDDYYDYGFYGNQGIDVEDCFYFLGTGPVAVRHYSAMTLGYTNASTTTPPKVTSISPNKGLIGSTVNVTINGNGFKSDATVNAGSGITVSVTSVSSTQISASFDINTDSSTGGSHNVTVTSGGVTSNTNITFYVQIPTSLALSVGNLLTHNGDSIVDCHGNVVASVAYGYSRSLVYTVLDQTGTAITQTGMTATEHVYKVSANPTDAGADFSIRMRISS